jgi:hypothetical protein
MKKRFFFSVILLISIGIGVGIASSFLGIADIFRAHRVVSQESNNLEVQTISDNLIPSTEPQPLNSQIDTFTQKRIDSTDAGVPNPVPTAIVSSADEIVKGLNAKAVQNLKPGWIHVRQQITFDTDTKNNGVLPNGTAIPLSQINDIWYQIDDQGLVIEVVSIMLNSDGQVVQVGVISDGTSWNSATNEIAIADQYKLDGLDNSFLRDLQWLEKFGNLASISQIILPNNQIGLQITIGDKFDQPTKTIDYDKPAIGAETTAVFDQTTGNLISEKIVYIFDDESVRVYKSYTQDIKFEPPAVDVLNYLSEKANEVNK